MVKKKKENKRFQSFLVFYFLDSYRYLFSVILGLMFYKSSFCVLFTINFGFYFFTTGFTIPVNCSHESNLIWTMLTTRLGYKFC